MLPELHHNHVHVWTAWQHASPHTEHLAAYDALLNPQERERESRLHFEHDRVRFRVTRALVRSVLGGYADIDPRACEFETNEFGRPAITNAEARRDALNFNVSHTRDLILLGVTRGGEIGLDVERVTNKRATVDLASRFFAPFESEQVVSAPEAHRDEIFFRIWTLKESYIKARGKGMHIPLGKFGFNLTQRGAAPGAELWTDPVLQDDASRWAFTQFQPSDAHWAAICTERRAGAAPAITVRNFATLPAR